MAFDREQMKLKAAELAAAGVFIGTSSWKYGGWMDQLYSRDRYEFRGKFAQSRFEWNCLTEYAEVFKTVCVDAAYYRISPKNPIGNHCAHRADAEKPKGEWNSIDLVTYDGNSIHMVNGQVVLRLYHAQSLDGGMPPRSLRENSACN